MQSTTKEKSPTKGTSQSTDSAAAHEDSQVFTKFVGKLEAKPQEQLYMSLGCFTSESPAKGFSIELDSEDTSPETVITKITTDGTPTDYKMVLQMANYGNKTVSAEVWRI